MAVRRRTSVAGRGYPPGAVPHQPVEGLVNSTTHPSGVGRRRPTSARTTRVIAIKGERLISGGPFRFLPHPNYTIVAIELAALPLTFGLYLTAGLFTVLNALVILGIRLPVERRALQWSQE